MLTESTPTTPSATVLLRRAGLRLTPQRLAIARELLSRSHPTAGEIYQGVQAEFPTMGLGTVYATLKTLLGLGLVHELPFADVVRYDPNLTPHVNLVCARCQRIVDVDACDDLLLLLRDRASGRSKRSSAASWG